jgi:hypothetical protein
MLIESITIKGGRIIRDLETPEKEPFHCFIWNGAATPYIYKIGYDVESLIKNESFCDKRELNMTHCNNRLTSLQS